MTRPETKYVCISDLHLGARYSVLTGVEGEKVVPQVPSDSLQTMCASLHQFLDALQTSEPPTLVLLGDVVDFALCDRADLVEALGTFLRQLMPDGTKYFAETILYLPGNHDHHIWKQVQETHYHFQLKKGETPRGLVESTPLLEASDLTADLLKIVLDRVPHLQHMNVEVQYPNYALVSADGKKCVALHHGHFTESMYRAVTEFTHLLSLSDKDALTPAELERQNGNWIDFVWSSFGESGVDRHSAFLFYETILDAGESHRFTRKLAHKLTDYLAKNYGLSEAAMADAKGLTLNQLINGALDGTIGEFAEVERLSFRNVLSDSTLDGLKWYVEGPLFRQLITALNPGSELLPTRFDDLTFVFGHTHKPFQDQLSLAAYTEPVKVFNTGGWVADKPVPTAVVGGSVVLIDDALNVGALRLYNAPIDASESPVFVSGTGSSEDEDNPLLQAMQAALAKSDWSAFRSAVHADFQHRANLALRMFFDPEAHPGQPRIPHQGGQ